MTISEQTMRQVIRAQKNEITEHYVYRKLAKIVKGQKNREIFEKIANDEKNHYEFWKKFTGRDIKPSKFKIFFFVMSAKILGLTFGVRLMERGEDLAQSAYHKMRDVDPGVRKIIEEEEKHEDELLDYIDTKGLQYTGSIILGLNDALVELTGALAGLTLALQNTRLIAMVGMITGIAAAMSMAASEYLSAKEEEKNHPLTSSLYTGFAYIITVVILITPYFLFANPFTALVATLAFGLVVIFIFTFYSAVARNVPFKGKFLEMAMISLGIAALNFGIGFLVKTYLGVGEA